MKLSPLSQKTYEQWIKTETWYTGHPLDKQRFYNFVRTFVAFSRKEVNEETLKQDIISRYSGKFDPEHLEQKADYYAYLFGEIVSYVEATK